VKAISLIKNRYFSVTDPLLTERKIEFATLVLLGLLIIQLAVGLVRWSTLSLPESRAVAPGSMQVSDIRSSLLVTEELRNEMVERPLFWSSRRFIAGSSAGESDAETAAASAGDLGKVKLLGIFGGGESAGVIALVDGSKQRILLGEEALEWTLHAVEMDRATFQSGAQNQELVLKEAVLPALSLVAPANGRSGGGAKDKTRARPKAVDKTNRNKVEQGLKSFGRPSARSGK